jgi:hypothetical protein
MINVKVNDRQVLDSLNKHVSRAKNQSPAFAEIGEYLLDSTQPRFSSATSSDGKSWAANSPVTVTGHLRLITI